MYFIRYLFVKWIEADSSIIHLFSMPLMLCSVGDGLNPIPGSPDEGRGHPGQVANALQR